MVQVTEAGEEVAIMIHLEARLLLNRIPVFKIRLEPGRKWPKQKRAQWFPKKNTLGLW